MQWLFDNPSLSWLAFGIVLIGFEAITVPGIGIFLAGLGAIVTAIVIEVGLVNPLSSLWQLSCFFIFTILFTLVLWKPLKKWRTSGKGAGLPANNMIGEFCVVVKNPLLKGNIGQVEWSGTIMNAQIDKSVTPPSLAIGTQAIITQVQGNVLTIIPKEDAL